MAESNPISSEDPLASFWTEGSVQDGPVEQEVETPIQEPVLAPEEVPEQPEAKGSSSLLNEADTQKMQFSISIQLFLATGFFFYLVMLMTVSGVSFDMIGLTTERLSQGYFILYVVFTMSIAHVLVRGSQYAGYRFFKTGRIGTIASILVTLILIILYIRHFELTTLIEPLFDFLPF